MFFIFLPFIFSKTSADLEIPFITDDTNHIGVWEFGGKTIVDENFILLTPPVQYQRGFLWTNVEIPRGNWGIEFQMKISEGTNGGGFGLWFISKYGSHGILHGGPSLFEGLAFIGTITDFIPDESNKFDKFHPKSKILNINIIQNQFTQKNTEYNPKNLPNPIISIPIEDSQKFSFKLLFHEGTLHISYIGNYSSESLNIASIPITVDISQNYIGFTAQNEEKTSRFDIYSVSFILNPNIKSISSRNQVFLGSKAPLGTFSPEKPSKYRSPYLKETTNQYQKAEEFYSKLKSSDNEYKLFPSVRPLDVIIIADELSRANYEVAKLNELNDFVRINIRNYSEKWQKRTYKIVNLVQAARNTSGVAWEYTRAMIEGFNATMKSNVMKTHLKIIDLSEILQQEKKNGIDDNGELKALSQSVRKEGIPVWLIIVMLSELVAIFLLVFICKSPFIQNKVIRRSAYHN